MHKHLQRKIEKFRQHKLRITDKYLQYMSKYLKLLSNKIKMPFQLWSKAIMLKVQSSKSNSINFLA